MIVIPFCLRWLVGLIAVSMGLLSALMLARAPEPEPLLSVTRLSSGGGIWLLDLDRQAEYHLFAWQRVTAERWSPDTRRVAYTARDERLTQLYIHVARSGANHRVVRQLSPDLSLIGWSPDSEWLLLYDNTLAQILYLTGFGIPVEPQFLAVGQPDVLWSPDSSALYFRDGARNLSVLGAGCLNGGLCFPSVVPSQLPVNRLLGWMPDGATMMVSVPGARGDEVYTLDPVTGDMRLLLRYPLAGVAPAWSPDGQSLAMSLALPGSDSPPEQSQPIPGLYLIDAQTGQRFLVWAGIAGQLSWTPDGDRLAFELVSQVGNGRSVWVYRRGAESPEVVGEGMVNPVWVTYRGRRLDLVPLLFISGALLFGWWLWRPEGRL